MKQPLKSYNHSIDDFAEYITNANLAIIKAIYAEDYEMAATVRDNIQGMIMLQTDHLHSQETYSCKIESDRTWKAISDALNAESKKVFQAIMERKTAGA